jgi:hypothetical protein
MEGAFGILLPNRNPLCLKVTISPGLSCHFEVNAVVVGDAMNFTPLGL